MRYIGNQPHLKLIEYESWDYLESSDPAVDTNPNQYPVAWLNTTTGEQFVCVNNTRGANQWVGSLGTTIGA